MDTSLDGIKFRDSKGEMTIKLTQEKVHSKLRELSQSFFESYKKIQLEHQKQISLKQDIKYLMENHYTWSGYHCYIEVESHNEIGHVLVEDNEEKRMKISVEDIDYIKQEET